jgi:arylformamidase
MDNPEPDEHRVEFDFELEFTNGGALQGQGFRLDIDGHDISDQELGAYIVSDLRLLMVGDVRILNKRILRECHKRSAAVSANGAADDGRARIDLSHSIEHGMITYPGLPGPKIGEALSHTASRSRYGPGTEFQIGEISMVANTGTYVDSPFHRYRDGDDLARLTLDRIADLNTVVVNLAGSKRRAVQRQQLRPYDVAGKAVLVHIGWDRYWRTNAYLDNPPFLTADAANHLVAGGALLVGVDWLNIDNTEDPARPVHSLLLGAGIPICENLTNLSALPTMGARFSAVPVKVHGMGTFPVRAYATVPATSTMPESTRPIS